MFEVSQEERDEDKELEGRGWAVNYESVKYFRHWKRENVVYVCQVPTIWFINYNGS